MSTQNVVISAFGPDRVGIVTDTTKMITDAGGNIGDSRMSRLSGHFSMLMTVSGPAPTVAAISESLEGKDDGMVYKVAPCEPEDLVEEQEEFAAFFRLEGADSPGLVSKVTAIFADHALSVDYIETGQESAPFGGTTLFSMDGRITMSGPPPATFDPDLIRDKLDDLAEAENVD
ncbi:hypothetical protein TrRE_jg3401, partial [Triparma retinervis]